MMSPTPLRPGEGTFPEDQIFAPQPPSRVDTAETGVARHPAAVTIAESYRRNIVRIWPDGLKRPAVDLIPDQDCATHAPSELFGSGVSEVLIVSGVKSFGRLTTREEDADSLLRLRWFLDYGGWQWRPTVATSPDRQWVEGGALLLQTEPEAVSHLARRHGQAVILRWSAEGLAAVDARVGAEPGEPVPVRLEPARTGCPLRCGAQGVCKMYGGPWTSSSITAALVWQNHRSLLLDAFGCDVCHAEGGRGATGAAELFTPSREGGWQWGLPRTLPEMRSQH